MVISSAFDGGNIACRAADSPGDIRLEILKDNQSDFYQWFYFRLTGARGQACKLHITNAGKSAYTKGWEGYNAVASDDRQNWRRVATTYKDGVLTIEHTPRNDSVWFAYFAPYTMERHSDLIARVQASPLVRLSVLGKTLDGQDMDLLQIGEPAPDKRICWAVARQHPGESMAEWWMEGFLDRLLDPDDAGAKAILDKAVFYLVPNMNPDGSRRGHLRTNAAGANLNREWAEPTLEKSPEVFLVRSRMHETGVDICLDVHGDEALPYNFLAGMMGIPSLSDRQKALQADFDQALLAASPEFQTEQGYPASPPGKGNLTMCANYVAEAFGCLSLTLEMPFKDNADRPEPEFGWSPERSRDFGAAHIDAIAAVLDDLR
ncbi:MAG: carboxypeptidase family protein [Alphaproteobacteria bacterium]|nr:carboxypeptidase family protein [Alphaproteobacteria bacterium]